MRTQPSTRRALLRFAIVVACAAVIVGLTGRSSHAQRDTIAESLGLTVESGSLPIWKRPPDDVAQALTKTANAVKDAVLLVGNSSQGYGTAFVLSREHRLAVTNAHVADILHQGGSMMAIVNGGAQSVSIERVWYHPGVRRYIGDSLSIRSSDPADGDVNPNSPDVAVLQLAAGAALPDELTLATPEKLDELFAQPVAMMGFPGYDTTTWPKAGEVVQATYHEGVVSRLSDFAFDVNAPTTRQQFVQHTMSSWGGFSGSPIFLPSGEVVAIHNMSRMVARGGEQRSIPYGVRIDCLWELLVYHGLADELPNEINRDRLDLAQFSIPDEQGEKLLGVRRLVQEATVLCDNKKYVESIAKLNEAVRTERNYAPIYFARASAYAGHKYALYLQSKSGAVQRRDLDWANDDIRKYMKLAPGDFWGLDKFMQIKTDSDGFSTSVHGSVSPGEAISPFVTEMANKLIASGNLSDEQLAAVYRRRACSRTRYGPGDQGVLSDLSMAIQLDPDNSDTYYMRGEFTQSTQPANSARDFAKAKELDRQFQAKSAYEYAWELATSTNDKVRDGKKSLDWAIRACKLTDYKNVAYLETLAAAHAELGDFKAAADWQQKALNLAPVAEKDRCQIRLEMYRDQQPYRQ